mgnify:CR=1 FL=1
MKIDFIPNLTGVFGHPVAENPTVLMMEAGYKAVGLDNWKYLTTTKFISYYVLLCC